MQQPPTTRTTASILSPYRHGALKWDDYVFDTQQVIYDGARAQVAATDRVGLGIRNASAAAVAQADAHQRDLLEALNKQTEANGVAADRVVEALDRVTDDLAAGFGRLADELAYHSRLLESIDARLDRIVNALENPLATQANELFKAARYALTHHLYAEALQDLLAAAEKRAVNPLLHLHLAQLHFRVGGGETPVDLPMARRHAELAIRYVSALKDELGDDAVALTDLVFRTAAQIAFIMSSDAAVDGDTARSRAELAIALQQLRSVAAPRPNTRFFLATVLAARGDYQAAITEIRSLADFTRAWLRRALMTSEMAPIADDIDALWADLRDRPGVYSEKVYRAAAEAEALIDTCELTIVEVQRHCPSALAKLTATRADFEAGAVTSPVARDQIESLHRQLSSIAIDELLAKRGVLLEQRDQNMMESERILLTPPELSLTDLEVGLAGGLASAGALAAFASGVPVAITAVIVTVAVSFLARFTVSRKRGWRERKRESATFAALANTFSKEASDVEAMQAGVSARSLGR